MTLLNLIDYLFNYNVNLIVYELKTNEERNELSVKCENTQPPNFCLFKIIRGPGLWDKRCYNLKKARSFIDLCYCRYHN